MNQKLYANPNPAVPLISGDTKVVTPLAMLALPSLGKEYYYSG
jgi:hypothetical protein